MEKNLQLDTVRFRNFILTISFFPKSLIHSILIDGNLKSFEGEAVNLRRVSRIRE